MFSIKMLPKDQIFKNLNLNIDGEIGGNLSMIGTATLNSLGLKEKANQMPRGEKGASAPFSPKESLIGVACFTDSEWFCSLKQLVKLSSGLDFVYLSVNS